VIDRLGPESRALVDAARDGLGPDDVAVRRMRGRISAAVAGGAAVGGLAATAHAAAGTTTTASSVVAGSIVTKLAVVAVVAAGAAVGTHAVLQHRAAPSPEHVVAVPARVEHARPIAPPPAPVVVAPTLVEPIVIDPPPPPAPTRVQHRVPVAAVAPVPEVAAPSLARETELVDVALADVSHNRFADALAAIARYRDVTTGHGQLAEDADAIEIEALCRLDDARSSAAFDAFTSQWPHAHEIDRLTAICRR
jgi:hypothetical protein